MMGLLPAVGLLLIVAALLAIVIGGACIMRAGSAGATPADLDSKPPDDGAAPDDARPSR